MKPLPSNDRRMKEWMAAKETVGVSGRFLTGR